MIGPRGAVLRFCVPCQARERLVVAGRCVVCGRRPQGSPEPSGLALAVAELEAVGYLARARRATAS